jgi:DNA gyrase/topoisomerase IV subunit B
VQAHRKPINLSDFSEAVRKRPGMYFGCGSPRALVHMVLDFIRAAIDSGPKSYSGPVIVSTDKKKISIDFPGLTDQIFSPTAFSLWVSAEHPMFETRWVRLSDGRRKSDHTATTLLFCLGASKNFEITESNSANASIVSLHKGKFREKHSSSRSKHNFLRVSFTPDPNIFGSLDHDQIYEIAGGLRDLTLLRAGLTTVLQFKLRAGKPSEIRYMHARGIESFTFEESGSRIPLFDGALKASGKRKGMQFECAIRFVHAGIPRIRTWVNFAPSQGGAHLEGLGKALSELFGNDYGGCRTHPLITNPDSGEKVLIPYSFIGALHFQTASPRFQGPTKDVLIGDEIKDFVYQSAKKQFAAKWPALRTKRAL